jgi:hypothetical protein
MIVRCIGNTGELLPPASRDPSQGFSSYTEFPLTVGRSYVVHAITVLLGITWYYVMDDDGHAWPNHMPATLFDVVDGTLPDSWEVGYHRFAIDNQYPIVSFPEWANDHRFYERLVDGDPGAVATFAQRRREIKGDSTRPIGNRTGTRLGDERECPEKRAYDFGGC